MYCSHCGAQIDDEAVICIHCGVATRKHQQSAQSESNPLALIGFILSFFIQIAGLICSIIAYRRCKDDPNLEGKGLALAGIIISAVVIGLVILVFLLYFSIILAILESLPNIGELAYTFTTLIK